MRATHHRCGWDALDAKGEPKREGCVGSRKCDYSFSLIDHMSHLRADLLNSSGLL